MDVENPSQLPQQGIVAGVARQGGSVPFPIDGSWFQRDLFVRLQPITDP